VKIGLTFTPDIGRDGSFELELAQGAPRDRRHRRHQPQRFLERHLGEREIVEALERQRARAREAKAAMLGAELLRQSGWPRAGRRTR
jgi:hypothetical protein